MIKGFLGHTISRRAMPGKRPNIEFGLGVNGDSQGSGVLIGRAIRLGNIAKNLTLFICDCRFLT